MTEISFMLRNEVVRFDPDRIGAMEREIGPEATEDVLFQATERLVDRLIDLRQAYEHGRQRDVANVAYAMSEIAEQVGLVTVARVANDVIQTTDRGNDPAYHATTTRLIRIGEGCVTGEFDFSDQIV